MTEDHIDRTQRFLDSLERLGEQLKLVEAQQKTILARMLDLKKASQTETDEYAELDHKSKAFQDIIDKYRPIYLMRMDMVKQVTTMSRRKRNPK